MAKRIDCHVHLIGNGKNGSGSWLNLNSRYHRFLARVILNQIGLPPAVLVSDDLESHYLPKLLSWVRGSDLDAVVLLAMEHVYDDSGNCRPELGSFYVPNDQVLALAAKHPEFLAGVSIHPARLDAIEELERCAKAGAVLMKCLPNCHNINCNDPRYTRFWEKMAELKMPLLAHTGGELSVPVYNKRYADPMTMTRPLEIGVTVIMAHAATSSLPFEENYLSVFGQLLERFPNLYGDNSALNTPYRSKHLAKLLHEPFHSRMIHGSDLPIPVSATWGWLRGLVSWSDLLKCRAESNLIQRDLILKKALGFNSATFERLGEILTGRC